jgi:ABC-type amino acid transport substrate-binding protein/RimJ/RimL family protein N-acetyltransferase
MAGSIRPSSVPRRPPRRPSVYVEIRPARLSDIPVLIDLYMSQPEESRRLYHPFPFDRLRLRAIFTYMVGTRPVLPYLIHRPGVHAAVLLVACLPDSSTPVGYGNTAFIHPEGPEPRAFFGYLVSAEYRSRGIGAQLHDALVDAALALGVQRGGGIIMTDNAANVRLVEKLGLRPTESDVVDTSAPGAANYRVDTDLVALMHRRRAELARAPIPRPTPARGGGRRVRPTSAAFRQGVFAGGVVAVSATLVLAGLLGLLPLQPPPATSAPPQILYLGTSAPFPPFDNLNATNGAYSGFDIDFATLIAQATHRTLVIQNFANLSTLLSAVVSGQVDLAGSALAFDSPDTGNLTMGVDISIPYRDAGQAVLVTASSVLVCPAGSCAPTSLGNLTVGVLAGRASDTWVTAHLSSIMPNPGSQIRHFLTVKAELAALSGGVVDALVIDQDVAASIATTSAGVYHVAGETTRAQVYCFALPPGDPQGLLGAVNGVIVESQANGTYQQLVTKWFG